MTVGIPVHNGASTLPRALDSVVGQTYENLEIILSDNASTDETPTLGRDLADKDTRVRYVRHDRLISAVENFRFVLEQATGDYFMWAADDDAHSPNYVETLAAALSSHPDAMLAISDIVRFEPGTEPSSGTLFPTSAADEFTSYKALVRDVVLSGCSEFYGLYRTEGLRGYPWVRSDFGIENILLFYVRLRGKVVYAPGAVFYNSVRGSLKTMQEQLDRGIYPRVGRFRMVRLAWELGKAAASASRHTGLPARRAWTFAYSYFLLRSTFTKMYLYRRAPVGAVRLWRRVKGGNGSRVS